MAESEKWVLDRKAAEFYEKSFVPAIFDEWARILVSAADISPGQRVLDAACGTGIVARRANEHVGNDGDVVGLDLNPSMIEVARQIRPDLQWREGDVTNLPFDDESFDVVLCQAALMFVPEPVAALREMHRVLRPGGKLAVQVFGESAGYDVTADIVEQVAGEDEAAMFRMPFVLSDRSDFESLFAEAGIEPVTVETRQAAARFSSLETFLRTEIDAWILAGRVDVDAMLEPARDRLQPFFTESGAVNIPMEGHIAVAS